MRRENRNKSRQKNSNTSVYITAGILIIAIIAFVISFIVYSNKLDNDSYVLDSEYLAKYTNSNNIEEDSNMLNQNTTSASSSIGKTVEESKNNASTSNNKTTTSNKINNNTNNNITNSGTVTNKTTSTKTKTIQKDPVFQKPLEGEILKEYAKDNLVYSETLKEWITHLAIDIKVEKATVVKASAEGTVKSIKNDPRYGLTIIIEHSNGFETRYANLLTTEFVSEGEKVKAGQTIGTVGDTAVYEIVDEPHLHFEILKNGENINPSDYIKF